MQQLPTLKPGDNVEIIVPASRCLDKHLVDLKELLTSWGLNCIIDDDIFGEDLLCANTDTFRFNALKNALLNPRSKAIICARGGYGSMRLIPKLAQVTPPTSTKLFVGMSDITALHLYLQNEWQWPTIHGALAIDKFSPESIMALKSVLFGETKQVKFSGIPLNTAARKNRTIESTITGGNLCLVETSIGTIWQINGRHKILFLEEVNERGYRVDRMLEHMDQANVFEEVEAIIFGDFTHCEEKDGSSIINSVLERFSQGYQIPIVRIEGIGHGYINFPLPLGTSAKLQLGNNIHLVCNL